jgi:ABC-type multidrug transport system fused ATPase/permease subunit
VNFLTSYLRSLSHARVTVGRTGSGKSTLTLALLHAIITEGSVYYDGVKTSSVNLEELRSKVTVIPQVVRNVLSIHAKTHSLTQPELLNGTLRHTLDMFGEHNDVVLNSALQAAGLFALQDNLGERGLNLDSQIAAGGANLSIGQRQVIGAWELVWLKPILTGSSARASDCSTEQARHTRRSNIRHW